jgi:hypothetical protein
MPVRRRVRERGSRPAALLGWRCWAGVDRVSREGVVAAAVLAAMMVVPWGCRGGGGASGRAAGRRAVLLAGHRLRGEMMKAACWGGRAVAGMLRHCWGGIVEVALAIVGGASVRHMRRGVGGREA